jgi:uncharacterized protein (TIGR02246 family)
MRRIGLVGFALVLLAACQPTSVDLTEDQRLALVDTILQVQIDLVAAAEAVDAEAVLSFFAPDVGLVMDGRVVGYASLSQLLRQSYGQMGRQTVEWHPAEVSVLSPDAVALTLGGVVTVIGMEGDTVSSGPVAWTEVFVRRNGGWKLLHAHQSTPSAGSS